MRKMTKRLGALSMAAMIGLGGVPDYLGILNNDAVVSISAATQKKAQKSTKKRIIKKVNEFGVLTYYNGSGELYLSDNITAIATYALDDAKISGFRVSPSNTNFKVEDGVLYTKNGKRLVRYPNVRPNTVYTTPGNVTHVSNAAFRNANVKTVVLSNNIKKMGSRVFYKCRKLEKVSMPEKIGTIGNEMFYKCKSLTSVTLPKHLKVIGEQAFRGCKSLQSIKLPNSLEKIKTHAFYDCSALEQITLPNKIEKVPLYCFENCSALKTVTLGNGIEEIEKYAFSKCTSLNQIHLSKDLYSIGQGAFIKCKSLKKVNLPSGLERIKQSCFKEAGVETIDIPNSVNFLGEYAFSKCVNLKSVKIGSSVKYIEGGTFRNCENLEKLTLSSGLKDIEWAAFANDKKLGRIFIPSTVSYISSSAFYKAGESFFVDESNSTYCSVDGVIYSKDMEDLILYPYGKAGDFRIPDSVSQVNSNAFDGCEFIKKLTLSDSMHRVYLEGFSGATIETIEFGDNLDLVIDPGLYEVRDIYGLKKIILPENPNYVVKDDVLYDKEMKQVLLYPVDKTGTITLPATLTSVDGIRDDNKAKKFVIPASSGSVYATMDGIIYSVKHKKIKAVPGNIETCKIGADIKNIDYLIKQKQYLTKIKAYEVAGDNKKYYSKDGVLYRNDGVLVDVPSAKSGEFKVPSSVEKIKTGAFVYTNALSTICISKNVISSFYDLASSAVKKIKIEDGALRKIAIFNGEDIELIEIPSSIVSVYANVRAYDKLTVKGWTNSAADRFAKSVKAKFVSVGYIPVKLKNVRIEAYGNERSVKLLWKVDPNVSGYEVSYGNRVETITNNKTNNVKIWVGSEFVQIPIIVRAYKIYKGKKIFGKSKKITYYPK